jgi:Fe-S-cluster-containing dehydrogenase component
MDRRRFIKKSGVLLLGSAAASGMASVAVAEDVPQWAMIIDLNRCIGCQSCVIACKNQSKTTTGNFNTKILSVETGRYPAARIVYTPVQCNHCDNPPCVAACPVGATFKLANGIVVTDWDKCQADGACVAKCPYGARSQDPRYGNKADKCDFCLDRLNQGLEPACVESCPAKARIFGDTNRPLGEFAAYLKQSGLKTRKAGYKTGPQIHYLPSRQAEEGIL